MELTLARLGCIVLVFFLGYYFGRQARRDVVPPASDPADWWKTGGSPPGYA